MMFKSHASLQGRLMPAIAAQKIVSTPVIWPKIASRSFWLMTEKSSSS